MKQVAILGTGGSWMDAPFEDQEIDIWGLNYLNKSFEHNEKSNRFTRWFHMHTREYLEPCIDFLRDLPIPLYTLQHYEDLPNSIAYPKEEVEKEFDIKRLFHDKGRKFWVCSTAYMFALAIYEGYEKIYLFGINMGSDDQEYREQRPAFEYLIGRAHERGIEVVIPDSSNILKVMFDYGYEECPIGAKVFQDKISEIVKIKEKLLKSKANHEEKLKAIHAQLFRLDGMLEISEHFKKLFY